jgi:elongation factor Ts
MEISKELIKKLRDRTGAGFMDCKEALKECGGDLEKAVDYLREKGLARLQKRSSRAALEGIIASYIHTGGKIGSMVEINCETDFVANTKEFHEFAKDIAMQIAATNPLYIRREDVDEATKEREKNIYKRQALEIGKPESIAEKIAEGKLEKFYSEVCLLEQPFIKNPDVTVKDLLKEMALKLGENIVIRRFARFQLGELEES